MNNKSLDTMAEELIQYKTLNEKQTYLAQNGRLSHIIPGSKISKTLSEIDPQRFLNIGANFYFHKDSDSNLKYQKICIHNAEYLYEYFPLIFEFYDEYLNSINYEEQHNSYKSK